MSTPPHHPCGASATGEREGNQADLEREPASRMPRPLAGLADWAPPPGARTRPARGPCASRTALCLVTRCDTRGPYRAVPPRAKPSGRQAAMRALRELSPCSFGLSATSQQYFSLRTNQPSAISQQYFSLRTNQHQPSATEQAAHRSLQKASPSRATATTPVGPRRLLLLDAMSCLGLCGCALSPPRLEKTSKGGERRRGVKP
jgi:hypothetical protein